MREQMMMTDEKELDRKKRERRGCDHRSTERRHGDKVHFFVEESLCNSMYVRNRVFFHKGVSEAKLWKRERDKN